MRPFFFAAKAEHTAAAALLKHVKQFVLLRHDFITSTTASQKDSNGIPSMRSALSKATISDSVDEWDTTDCFLHTALRGKNVLGPTRAANKPVVDLEVETQSAKEASVNSMMVSLSAESPIQPWRQ